MQHIKEIVSAMVKKHKTSSPYELCDFLNIIVINARLPQSLRGFANSFAGKVLSTSMLICPMSKKK